MIYENIASLKIPSANVFVLISVYCNGINANLSIVLMINTAKMTGAFECFGYSI